MKNLSAAAMALILAIAAAPTLAFAQVTATNGAAVVPSDPAQLYRIEDGLFQISAEQLVEITDQLVTFTFRGPDSRERIYAVVNGRTDDVRIGDRLDFKKGQAGSDKTRFQGKDRCFLDVVSFQVVKGAPTTGVFRVHCL